MGQLVRETEVASQYDLLLALPISTFLHVYIPASLRVHTHTHLFGDAVLPRHLSAGLGAKGSPK